VTDWDDFTDALTGFLGTVSSGANLILLGPDKRLFQVSVHENAIVPWAQADGSAGSWPMPAQDGEVLRDRGWILTQGAWSRPRMLEDAGDAHADVARAVVAALRDAMHVASPSDLFVGARMPDGTDLDVSALRFQRPAPAAYDTTGWRQNPDRSGWTDPETGVGLSLTVRDELDEPYWLEDLDLARRKLAHDYSMIGCLIEAFPVTVGGVRGMAQLFKVPDSRWERGRAYAASVFLAKAGITVNLGCVLTEGPVTGTRETLVALQTTDSPGPLGHPYDPELQGRLPYLPSDDEVWDQHSPEHPLSVVRAWVRGLDRIVWIDPAFAALPDYRGSTRS
jgi:hypothetical protein